jgi:hypothetical protein
MARVEAEVAFGSISEVVARNREVCFATMSRRRQLGHACLKSARSGHTYLLRGFEEEALGQRDCRITSLALARVRALSP